MVYKYKVGDKVRIKEKEGKGGDYPFGFTDEMNEKFANKIVTIQNVCREEARCCAAKPRYNGDENGYRIKEDKGKCTWHSSMFEPILENPEQKIQNLNSLKVGDLILICGIIGSIYEWDNSEYYLNFNNIRNEQEHFACCKKLRELVPNFEKIANEFNAIHQQPDCFPVFSTIDDLMKFIQAVNNVYNSKKSITTPKTSNENEIRFQKQKATIRGGSVPTGHSVCGRTSKTAVTSGHLSYKEISC